MVFPLQGIAAWPSPLKIQAFFVAIITGHILISFIFFSSFLYCILAQRSLIKMCLKEPCPGTEGCVLACGPGHTQPSAPLING